MHCIRPGDIILAQFEVPDRVILQAFKNAKACGATTLLNPAPIRAIRRDIRDLTDLLVVNEHELAALAETPIDTHDDASLFAV
ncbi:MAG: ribokinase, partial [Gammaproteobacteria bacterium]